MQEYANKTDGTDETVIERLNQLEEKVDSLEKENSQLKDQNEKLKSAVANLENKNKKLKQTVEKKSSQLQEISQTITVIKSRLDGVCNSLDTVEEDVNNTRRNSEKKYADLASRLSTIEDTLELDVIDISTVDKNANTVIEQFAQLPEEVKENQLTDSMRRATSVYENFRDWSKFTPKGNVIKSSDLKKFLSTAYDEDFEWSQIYRVMDSFDDGTPPEFEQKQLEKHGKVLIRYHDTTQARADASTNTVVSSD